MIIRISWLFLYFGCPFNGGVFDGVIDYHRSPEKYNSTYLWDPGDTAISMWRSLAAYPVLPKALKQGMYLKPKLESLYEF